ncbi:D-alanyl-D-alanine carboxypeptidase DacF precursor [bacterium BMS3Bbin10]|nr:D-alanyl-D-alanine carboxypeptidase DacF precursor [bacterium BMS3Bbin10]
MTNLPMQRYSRGVAVMVLRVAGVAVVALALLFPARLLGAPALVFDPQKGTILYQEDMDALWHPASLTKLMTAYLTFEALREGKLKLDGKIVTSKNANAQAPSKIGLPVGASMRVELAIKALLVKSANDVAVMLAEAVAGSEPAFVKRMNATAKRLGMRRSRFVNPNGLPDDRQITTARDMAYLARALIKEYPEYAHFFAIPYLKIGKRRMRNYNGLLRTFEGADGMKTGFVCSSGYNIVVSATRRGRKLVAVVLGGKSGSARNQRAASLLDHGFRRYRWRSLFGKNIDKLTIQASLTEGAPDLRSVICKRKRKVRKRRARKKTIRKKK